MAFRRSRRGLRGRVRRRSFKRKGRIRRRGVRPMRIGYRL